MEFEGYKSVWLDNERRASRPFSDSATFRSLRLLRLSGIQDWQKTRERSRVIFSFLFAFAAALAALAALPSGTSPVVALLLALALLIQGVTATIGIIRMNQDSDRSMRDYLAGAHRHATFRYRLERFSHASFLILTAAVLIVVMSGPRSVEPPARQMDAVASMVILTAMLVVVWLKARSVALNRQFSQELEGYLRDLDK